MGIFYDNFVRLCAVKNVSESGAAQAIGLSNAAANGWKNGKMPSGTTRVKLADFFNVTVEELMGEGIKKERPAEGETLNAEDKALLNWFHSLSPEKRESLLTLGDAPEELREDLHRERF